MTFEWVMAVLSQTVSTARPARLCLQAIFPLPGASHGNRRSRGKSAPGVYASLEQCAAEEKDACCREMQNERCWKCIIIMSQESHGPDSRVFFLTKVWRAKVVKSTKFVAELNSEALAALNRISTKRDYAAGKSLFIKQQSPEYVFVIERGRVKISTNSREGRTVIVRIAGEGDVVGLSAAMSGKPYDVSAEAIERCQVRIIRVHDFQHLLEQYPQAAKAATDSALSKYQLVFQELCRLSLPHSVAGRIARLLLEWGDVYRQHDPTHDRLTVAMSHEELAEMSGTSRETVSRTLERFRREKLISVKGASIRILNRPALETLAA
jgi:CRP/FNR family cyclic AMP-dependent transcriptional regulator